MAISPTKYICRQFGTLNRSSIGIPRDSEMPLWTIQQWQSRILHPQVQGKEIHSHLQTGTAYSASHALSSLSSFFDKKRHDPDVADRKRHMQRAGDDHGSAASIPRANGLLHQFALSQPPRVNCHESILILTKDFRMVVRPGGSYVRHRHHL